MTHAGYTIPNLSDAAFPAQARLFDQDMEIIADGLRGNGVISDTDCLVTAQASPNMTVHVAAGNVVREGSQIAVTAGDLTITTADAANPRIDIVSVNNTGAKSVATGTPAAAPLPPTIPQVSNINNIVLAFIYIPAGDTAINTNQITDKRARVNAPGAGTGTVTHTAGNLTASAVMVGNGVADAKVLASLGTTTTLLHGNAAGLPTFAGVAVADHTATGTPSATTFLRGDNTWSPPFTTVAALGSDATTNSTTTGAKITGLDKTTGVGTFVFVYYIRYQSGAITTGVKFGVNHTGTVTAFMANLRIVGSGVTAADQTVTTPTAHGSASTRTETTTAPNLGPTISVDTANADMLAIIEGLVIVTVDGNLELWHASEVAAASTVKAGSSLLLTKTA